MSATPSIARQVLGPDVAREAPSRDRGHGNTSCIVSSDDRCKCREEQAFNQTRGSRDFDAGGPKA